MLTCCHFIIYTCILLQVAGLTRTKVAIAAPPPNSLCPLPWIVRWCGDRSVARETALAPHQSSRTTTLTSGMINTYRRVINRISHMHPKPFTTKTLPASKDWCIHNPICTSTDTSPPQSIVLSLCSFRCLRCCSVHILHVLRNKYSLS